MKNQVVLVVASNVESFSKSPSHQIRKWKKLVAAAVAGSSSLQASQYYIIDWNLPRYSDLQSILELSTAQCKTLTMIESQLVTQIAERATQLQQQHGQLQPLEPSFNIMKKGKKRLRPTWWRSRVIQTSNGPEYPFVVVAHCDGDVPACGYRPDIRGCKYILSVLSLRMTLDTANAYISTLGGGYFLCRHIDISEALALKQHSIAVKLGDTQLQAQCRIHLIYNLIQRGRIKQAFSWIQYEWKYANLHQNETLISMVKACDAYIRKVHAKRHELRKTKTNCKAGFVDEYARQRFVVSDADRKA